ncbi:hypothetical protein JL722_15294 [Aureococcus anophagefferens]|nr:hypothetical protein JL722_15294 [Aureococcus anophagefferens]
MSSAARRRLVRDFKRLQSDSPSGVTAAPNDNNILSWQICLDILQNQWSPIYDISILRVDRIALSDPNRRRRPTPGLKLFSENRREYNRRVREVVEQSWDERRRRRDDDDDDDDDDDETSGRGPAASTPRRNAHLCAPFARAPGRRACGGRGKCRCARTPCGAVAGARPGVSESPAAELSSPLRVSEGSSLNVGDDPRPRTHAFLVARDCRVELAAPTLQRGAAVGDINGVETHCLCCKFGDYSTIFFTQNGGVGAVVATAARLTSTKMGSADDGLADLLARKLGARRPAHRAHARRAETEHDRRRQGARRALEARGKRFLDYRGQPREGRGELREAPRGGVAVRRRRGPVARGERRGGDRATPSARERREGHETPSP